MTNPPAENGMHVEPAPADVVTGDAEPASYRVRVWTPPLGASASWLLDEWDITGAASVIEVVDWAISQTPENGTGEVFVRWYQEGSDAAGRVVRDARFTRVYGRPGDAATTARTVFFHSEG
jgi:hypothetical protein